MEQLWFQAIGADPEVFLVNKNGHPVSAEGMIGGTKAKPKQMEGLPAGFYHQEDNVAAEFNVPPSSNFRDFNMSIQRGLGYIMKLAQAKGLKVRVEAALHFPENQLQTPHARQLGCDPDLNLWDLAYNPRPEAPPTLRTAAGHVHVSWDKPSNPQRIVLARTLDVFLGIPSILVTNKNERRSLYGKAGSVRDKTYGLEYRTLDNFWITKAGWRLAVYEGVQSALNRVNTEQDFWAEALEARQADIRKAIDEHNVDLCHELMAEFEVRGFPEK